MPDLLDWQALILAGGRSRRMGRDKAQLPWRGRPLIDHLTDVLRAAGAGAVHVSGLQPDGRGIPDRDPDLGPVGGLASALPHIGDGLLMVLPVDLPLLDAALLAPLLQAPDAAACRYRRESLPLRLRLDRPLRERVEALLCAEPENRSLNRLFDQQQGLEIECPAHLAEQLLNCNSPADWTTALRSYSPSQNEAGGRSSTRPSNAK